jgi:ribonuclease P protein component
MPGDARLPRTRRLARRDEFNAATKAGRCSRDECFSVYVNRNLSSTQTFARLGITVARHVSLRAVVRNRIKRQIRESFRQHQHLFAGANIVVTAHRAANAKVNAALRASLSTHWQRVAKACGPSQPQR